jgi:adenosylmethionine-8-amino-7-oxononanoate aminotransferase
VIQLSPPLICDESHFDEIAGVLQQVLEKAATML